MTVRHAAESPAAAFGIATSAPPGTASAEIRAGVYAGRQTNSGRGCRAAGDGKLVTYGAIDTFGGDGDGGDGDRCTVDVCLSGHAEGDGGDIEKEIDANVGSVPTGKTS